MDKIEGPDEIYKMVSQGRKEVRVPTNGFKTAEGVAEAEAEARSGDGLCLTPMTARRGNSAGTSTSREDSAWRERCEAAESRAARATTALTEVAAKGAEERERAIANAVDAAVSDAERRWRAEMEELSRAARADAGSAARRSLWAVETRRDGRDEGAQRLRLCIRADWLGEDAHGRGRRLLSRKGTGAARHLPDL